jgi:adenylosuccinate synthase
MRTIQHAVGVIGAGFGDEGKGLLSDAMARRAVAAGHQTVVARFNGGAQAGHTVVTPDGRRHVFHHWAAGALAGASSYLGREFVCHPMLMEREALELKKLGAKMDILVDHRSRVTVPYDVMINQAIEKSRGSGRHGSCGVGFGEAIERNEQEGFSLSAAELFSKDRAQLLSRLKMIANDYVPLRLRTLGLPPDALGQWRKDAGVMERFMDDARKFTAYVSCVDPEALQMFDAVVFEGAQGLRLDEELGSFPYVTRSKTGLPYLLDIAQEAGIKQVDVTYATRAYATRHGAGPFPEESEIGKPAGFVDPTNHPNDWQGQLRFGALSIGTLKNYIQRDLDRAADSAVLVRHGVMVSCLDQMGKLISTSGDGAVETVYLSQKVRSAVGGAWAHESWGITSDTLRMALDDSKQCEVYSHA